MMLVYVLIILFIVLIMMHVVKGDIIEGATGSSDAAGETGAGGFVPAAGLLPTLIMGLAAALQVSRRRKDEAMTVNHPEQR